MRLFFLEANQPLTKRFWLNEEGRLEKDPYPFVKKFASHEVEVDTVEQFHAAILAHGRLNHCLLKGQLSKRLLWESRAGSTDPLTQTSWVVIDLDGLLGFATPEDFIREVLPEAFHDVSYVMQHSASSGIGEGTGLRAHLFFMLAAPAQPETIKNWVTRLNLDTPRISDNLRLSANAFTLRYPCDVTVNQNDKLIYIAPPLLEEGVEDTLKDKRVQLIQKGQERVSFDFASGSFATLQASVDARVADLRAEHGLARRKPRYKYIGNVQVLANPGQAYVSGEKIARGFTYLNLNGGDSWGYYFPTDNPKLLLNFKGEPAVVLRDFLPDYFGELQGRIAPHQRERPLVFRDPKSDSYFNGKYDPVNNRMLYVYQCGARDRLDDFMEQHGGELPDPIPDWTYEFRPFEETVVDEERRFINRWQPTDIWRHAEERSSIPPMVEKVIRSVVGNDEECFNHLLNWLACVVQFRVKIGTAWVLQGVQGTGKGLLINEIMRPIVGDEYCATKLLSDFDDKFNAEMESCLLMNIDEARISDMGSASRTVNTLKNLITDSNLRIRGMRQNAREIVNYTNFIFSSNNYDAMSVDPSDRRFNVAPRQEKRLMMTPEDIIELRSQVADFAGYLKAYEANLEVGQIALNNEAKEAMRQASQDTNEQYAAALLSGDLDYFVTFAMGRPVGADLLIHVEYQRTIKAWVEQAHTGAEVLLTLEDLMMTHRYLIGGRQQGPAKFARMLAHKNLILRRVKGHRGVRVQWQDGYWQETEIKQLAA